MKAAELLPLLPTGARLGESSAVSTCVHVLHSADPDAVTVLTDSDAGQVFYGRAAVGEIVHLDVFHAPGAVPPAAVAAAFLGSLRDWRACGVSADLFDVQTAVGGGRVSGDLRGGRRATVQAAHRGHVHLAGRLPTPATGFCFALVAAVERAVAGAGLQLRKPQRILALAAGPGGPGGGDLRDYAALTDTLLRGEGAAAGPAATGAPLGEEGRLQAAARLSEGLGGVEVARAVLEALSRPVAPGGLRLPGGSGTRARDVLARLVQAGWAEPAGGLWHLTPEGMALRATFGRRLREIELVLRTAARHVAHGSGASAPPPGARSGPDGRPRLRGAVPVRRGEHLVDLALAETALAAAARAGLRRAPLRVSAADLHLRLRHRPRRVDLCLLIDASASMEGGRMRAAKTLARHLLLTNRDRVAVMAFQERSAALAVPLTRNYAAVERGLRRVVPAGLTPLAAGLAAARLYLRGSHARNPLLLLVTDGIPTVSGAGGSPLEEALGEAERLRGSGVALCCIGLEPNERYLDELARRAGGRLHVVPELRPDLLAAVARRERLRRMEG